jgi:3-hydroxy-3-methylglutaryl CoA synthase
VGLKFALDAVKANSGGRFLVAASDLRACAPNSALELEFGDGAAALLIGDKDVVATISGHHSLSSEFMDTWRRDKDLYTQRWEDRFALSEGYQSLMVQGIKELFRKMDRGPSDYTRAAIYAPNARALSSVARAVGLSKEQISTVLFDRVGDAGTALAFMMLVEALEKSKPGDRLLLAAYGDGVDAFDLTVTEKIGSLAGRRGIEKHLASGMDLKNYGGYVRFRDLMEWEFDRRPPDRTSLPVINRERDQIYSLHGAKCRSCGVIQYPIQRVCPECQAKDDFDEVRLSDRKGNLFTFSMDERAMVPDLPNVLCIVDLDSGGRFYSVMTDRNPENIRVGMPVEMTFRRIHEGLMIYNYFWKVRPVRG